MARPKKNKPVVVTIEINGQSGDPALEFIVARVMKEYFELWQKKQRSYGPGNIGAFGALGCLIRSNDKIQRLRRHYFMKKNVSLSDETIQDTWLDMLGYALMGLVCERKQWPSLEFTDDPEEEE